MASQTTNSAASICDTYDYIIVGGGTSGLVVASRLTEDPGRSVLVIEAGADRTRDPRILTPGLMASLYGDPDFEWMISSIPQKQLHGRSLGHIMGRTLGGSSAINMCCVAYPSKANFDAWERLGNPGWGWGSLSPYFQNFSTLQPPSDKVRTELSMGNVKNCGTDGPIQVSFAQNYQSFHKAWIPTFKNLHIPIEGEQITGIYSGPFVAGTTIDTNTKTRSHSGKHYYNSEAAQRQNLTVLTESLVEKLILKKAPDGLFTAIGVSLVGNNGTKHRIFTRKEVILAAGSFKTPQLLELSGVGNASLLHSHEIEVLIDNQNVGENLQDHGLVPCTWEVADDQITGDIMRDQSVLNTAVQLYEQSGDGPLGEFPFVSSYVPLNLPMDHLKQLLIRESNNVLDSRDEALYKVLQISKEPVAQCSLIPRGMKAGVDPSAKYTFGMEREGNYITLCGILNHPFSRGSTHIHSADPMLNPIVDIGFLRHQVDLELHAEILMFLDKIASTEPMASLIKKNGRKLHLDHNTKSMETLADAKEIAKRRIVSNNHPCGTCAMLPKELGGVVNSRLIVYETKNLRIVDASIFPLIPRGNIQSSVYAIAERAADLILEDERTSERQRQTNSRLPSGKNRERVCKL